VEEEEALRGRRQGPRPWKGHVQEHYTHARALLAWKGPPWKTTWARRYLSRKEELQRKRSDTLSELGRANSGSSNRHLLAADLSILRVWGHRDRIGTISHVCAGAADETSAGKFLIWGRISVLMMLRPIWLIEIPDVASRVLYPRQSPGSSILWSTTEASQMALSSMRSPTLFRASRVVHLAGDEKQCSMAAHPSLFFFADRELTADEDEEVQSEDFD